MTTHRLTRRGISWLRFCAALALALTTTRHAAAVSSGLVISQVYGGGGNAGATYTNDFIEIFNRGSVPVTLNNYSVQYGSAAGALGSSASLVTVLPNVTLAPGHYLLVQEAVGAGGTVPLPSPDAAGTIAMSGTAGKVALVDQTAPLNCTACSLTHVVDLVGYGAANFFEGAAAAPALTNTTAALRLGGGSVETDDNAADFVAGPPNPRNSGGSTTLPLGACGDPATAIDVIQGSGTASPLAGTSAAIEGVVVGDFQPVTSGAPSAIDDYLHGFFVQQADGTTDGNALTSEGIFVNQGPLALDVNVGDHVRVVGAIAEVSSVTTLSATGYVTCPAALSAATTTVTFPVAAVSDLERYEGMRVTVNQPLTVTGNFDLGRFGSLDLSVGGRLYEATHLATPGPAAVAQLDLNARSRFILANGRTDQDPNPVPYKDSALNTRRTGDTLSSVTGILENRFGEFRLQPTVTPIFTSANPPPPLPPNVGGRLKVAAANMLNFFTTLDHGAGTGGCGPTGALDCRGANTTVEYGRQLDKHRRFLEAMNADVVGLMEMENNTSASLQALVNALNVDLGAGTYAFVDTGTIGTDAIKVGLIYKPAKVTPVGTFALLTTAVNPLFIDTKNRPSLAQTFQEVATRARFNVVVNHLKSKGSDCNDVGDPDTGDGQANCNQTRKKAAQALVAWVNGDATHAGDTDTLVLGDMNAYAKEDPIQTFENAGYTSLIETYGGASAYSYQFDGESGYLDHAFATPTMRPQVTGAAEWHINADEPIVRDYNLEFRTDDLYSNADPFRASDHDPLLVGLNLNPPPAPVPATHGGAAVVLAAALTGLGALLLTRRARSSRIT